LLQCSNQYSAELLREARCLMSRIGKTIEDRNCYRRRWLTPFAGDMEQSPADLVEIADFGHNPARLRLLAFVPDDLPPEPALVVALHGCNQTAAAYGIGSGWLALAAREGFILCLPEQRGGNNSHQCFNWFSARDTARGSGEAASIHAMTEHLALVHGVDRQRIFVTGLSAGGAMAVSMLAAYPDVFAAGAAIAGLSYRCATGVGAALEAMAHGDKRSGLQAADAVRAASDHAGPWPRLSVWHGTQDETVTQDNARALVRQWRHLHGFRAVPTREERVNGQRRRVWSDAEGRDLIELYIVDGLGHGAPLAQSTLGLPGPFLLEAGISSTRRIAEFWGLLPPRPSSLRRLLAGVASA
jgi:feruloyl esterase